MGYQGFGDMAKKHLDLFREAGKRGVVLPGENATDEDWGKVHAALGVPQDGKYQTWEFGGTKPDENMVKFAETTFPKAGVTPRGQKILVEGWNNMMKEVVANAQKAEAETLQKGEDEYAKAQGAKHAAMLDLSNRTAQLLKLTPEKIGAMKKALGVGETYGLLTSIANMVATDGENPSGGGSNAFTIQTAEGAKAEVGRMKADPKIAAMLRGDQAHGTPEERRQVKEKYDRLMNIITGV